jgi:uncharacterized protein YutE (UPF0331/DUF86 family)
VRDYRLILCENSQVLRKSLEWLQRSYAKAHSVALDKPLSESDFEILETLSNRFSRAVDILISKVLRAIDLVELEEPGSRLDMVIRAEKRGFVAEYKTLIKLKDLRNELTHEYLEEQLNARFREVVAAVPELVEIAQRVLVYVERYCNPASKSGS